MPKKFFITTPIYYINDRPHIGTAYTTVLADAIARFWREQNREVFFLTGTDEHGSKVAAAAKAASEEPQVYADKMATDFKKTWAALGIKFNEFARTTNPNHVSQVQAILKKIFDQGDIKKGKYKGYYCPQCEEYKTRSDQIEIAGQLACPIHKIVLEVLSEEVYFFDLPKYELQVKHALESDQLKILPAERKNEVLSFIESGLEPVAISRSRQKVSWGIPLPWDETQTIYVWVDALFNYVTFGGKNWPADLQLMSKDILRFHTIIWPALLLAAGLPLPKTIYVHGYFTVSGEKMSKSRGNVLRPDDLIKRYGVDPTRYLLLSALPFSGDGDVSIAEFDRKYLSDLVNGIGNLLQRVLVLAGKNNLRSKTDLTLTCAEADDHYKNLRVAQALAAIGKIIKDADQYIDREKPWQISDRKKLELIIQSLVNRLLTIAAGLKPVMPQVADEIVAQIKSGKPKALFPRLGKGTRHNEE